MVGPPVVIARVRAARMGRSTSRRYEHKCRAEVARMGRSTWRRFVRRCRPEAARLVRAEGDEVDGGAADSTGVGPHGKT